MVIVSGPFLLSARSRPGPYRSPVHMADASSSASVELEVVGYQFPDHAPSASNFDDLDANWLQVRGSVRTPDLSWSFTDPCLLTGEAAELGAWLRRVAERTVQPSEHVFGAGAAFFVEPNLSVRLAASERAVLTLVWYFSQESSPPGAPDEIRFGNGHAVQIAVSPMDLTKAADEWVTELRRFPPR